MGLRSAGGHGEFSGCESVGNYLDALGPQLTERNYVVIATIGEYDEDATQMALESPASYVGLVASNKRLASVKADLSERGVPEDQVARLKRPAGLSSFVIKPEEIAFSVMAELIEARHEGIGLRSNPTTHPQRPRLSTRSAG